MDRVYHGSHLEAGPICSSSGGYDKTLLLLLLSFLVARGSNISGTSRYFRKLSSGMLINGREAETLVAGVFDYFHPKTNKQGQPLGGSLEVPLAVLTGKLQESRRIQARYLFITLGLRAP